jgi:uncharacterized membrane protein YfcA
MNAELGPAVIAFVAVACLLAGFGHGALGFGFPIVATPLVALAIDIKSAIALLAPITLVLTVISALRGVALSSIVREFWFLPLATALGAWLGTHILLAMPAEPFLLILAGVILLYLNLDRFGRGRSALVQRLRMPLGAAFGFVAGVCEAVANVAGPILLIYFMLLGLAPAQIVQTLNLCFSLGKGAQTATWAMSGEISPRGRLLIGALIVPSVAALFAGMRVRGRIDAPTYRRWLRGALWIMAALLLVQFSTRVLASEEALWRAIEQDDAAAASHWCAPEGSTSRRAMRRATRLCTARRKRACAPSPSRCSRAAPRSMRAPRTARPRSTSPRWTRTRRSRGCCSTPAPTRPRRTTTANRS